MSAFASKGFNANAYLALRPTYSRALLQWLLAYHAGPRTAAADIACGPGTFTTDILPAFGHVIGVDPSPSMIASAQEDARAQGLTNVEYKQGFGEHLPIESNSIDFMTVMEGAHWFRITDFLNEALRVLRPGGTLALVGYSYPEIANWPESMKGSEFARRLATDEDKLMQYWDKGLALLETAYAPFLPSLRERGFDDIRHVAFPQKRWASAVDGVDALPDKWIDSKDMPLDGFRAYLKTWSAYKAWKDAHPNEEDILDAYFDKRQQDLGKDGNEQVTIEWPHFAIVARKPL
ncbi:S-adenosyl-L-methionine-dependent methyltransferase [Martensiomyces pterosporus]|nr:S-adenosyl-L-methionine-dependent methyltransferase [Martensiomyces pterosporus]